MPEDYFDRSKDVRLQLQNATQTIFSLIKFRANSGLQRSTMSSNAQVSNKRPYNESNAVNNSPKGGPAGAEEDGEELQVTCSAYNS